MIEKSFTRALFAFSLMIVCSACATADALKAPAAKVATAQKAFEDAITKGVIESSRNDRRIGYLQSPVNKRLLSQETQDKAFEHAMRFTLCEPVATRAKLLAHQENTRTIVGEILQTLDIPKDDWPTYIALLRADFVDNMETAASDAANRAQTAHSDAKTSCQDDFNEFPSLVFPRQDFAEEGLGALVGAAGSLWEIVKFAFAAIDGVAKEAAKEAILIRQADALNKFFSKPENVDQLKDDIQALMNALSDKARRERALVIRSYILKYIAFQSAVAKEMAAGNIKDIKSCVAFQAEQKAGSFKTILGTTVGDVDKAVLSSSFQACHVAILKKVEPKIDAVLKAAAAYDANIDKAPDATGNALLETIDKLKSQATGEKKPSIGSYVQIGLRWVAIVKKAQETISDEKLKKGVEERWKSFLEQFSKV